ncbi:glycoside hydrolase family 76 protein [Mucilaginibacter sp. SG564]|uniref:glycoside hydrolase family 76 protein n=1 Tax=unclassified Mucilaginibacter TaxID=2617802 RepID=UPI0015557171|nr:glycoside hydrolase family 76 protein [Mucilaginibacter sp. SG564]NOW98410.1 putative alpha-1,6-mannanase (GH76 family) [Mucilaginibacter sp. SG564]
MKRRINNRYFKIYQHKANLLLHRGKQLAVVLSIAVLGVFASCKKAQVAGTDNDKVNSATTHIGLTAAPFPTKSEALVAMQVYNNHFYNQYGTYGPSYKAYYWKDDSHAGRMDFWTQQEAIETLIDAYNINPSTDFLNKIQYLYNGVRDGYGTLWSNNIYNDDVVWGSLMCIRAYHLTNDGGQLDMAKNNFNMMWNRAWDTSALGGGLWWNTNNNTKNTCVNAPAVICAMLLYQATGDSSYKTKAKQIMDWMIAHLYDANTGEVKGAIIPNGTITEGALSYTQGTFIGACDLLRSEYPSVDYLGIGKKAMDYAMASLCNSAGGILKDEDGNADTQGMKSIFARWACQFVQHTGTAGTYGAWLDLNAGQAWSIRNSSGLMWNIWGTRTSDTQVINAFQATCGVSMMNNAYLYH